MKKREHRGKLPGKRDVLLSFGIFILTCGLCVLLSFIGSSTNYAPMIFILSVFMTARFTNGYVCGIAAALLGVLVVNYAFTYPYLSFNFTLAGYPITIISMLAVSVTTSALTSRAKESEKIKIEAEREKTRSNLLRAVSHDLRTPLTSILGATSAVLENDAALTHEERVSLLQSAQDDAQWLIRVVENLLAVTRVDAEGSHIVTTPEAAEEVVAAAVAKFHRRFPDIEVIPRAPEELLLVPMDSVLIEQVLLNLLENAAVHGKTVDRIWLSVQKEGNKAVVEVRDNGVGLDPRRVEDITAGRMVSGGEKGDSHRSMGIGISVCHSIIHAHSGCMTAGNAPGGGAVFRFELALEDGYEQQ